MPIGVVVNTNELPQPSSGVPTSTGTLFAVGLTDQGPTTPTKCQTITDYTSVYGPRSATSATLYDALDTYFHEGGANAYVGRVSGSSAAAAALTLQDSAPHPTVTVTFKTAGVNGNNVFVVVSVASSKYTVTLQDANANVLETHGPFLNSAGNAPLLAETSNLVNFTQATGSGNTTAAPVALTATALTGGLNPSGSDVADANVVTTLANFPSTLGPGQVTAPGKTTATVWNGLVAHAVANNRFALLNLSDSAVAATQIGSAGAITATAVQAGYAFFIASSVVVPGVTPGTTRTVTGDVVVAALRSQVSSTGNDNQAPAGRNWPLQYVTSFTNTYSPTDINTLNAAGINVFANRYGVLCLFGFSTYVPATTDSIYWQASAACERMALVADAQAIGEQYLFDTLDGRQLTLTAFQGALQGLIAQHWRNNALFGAAATDAGSVAVSAPVNTAATMAAGQLNAAMQVRISPFAQLVTVTITAVAVTQTVS
jgi:hypothetical protein